MEKISLPTDITITPDSNNPSRAVIDIEPCYPGYATTLGNALRRVLLSSLSGSAVTAIKIKGVDHEFSTMEDVKEDVVAIILNCKGLKFKVDSDEPVIVRVKAKGKKVVTAGDVEKNSQAIAINTDAPICTLTNDHATFEAELTVQRGLGYVPVEQREKEKAPIGTITIDAVYTPVRTVNYSTENVRIAQMTNFERLELIVETDGSITPAEAFQQAAQILTDHFSFFLGDLSTKTSKLPEVDETTTEEAAGEENAEPVVSSAEVAAEVAAEEKNEPSNDSN